MSEAVRAVASAPAGTSSQAAIGKRMFDLAVACALLVIALPLLALISLFVATTSRGPVFYRHERFGLGGQKFIIYKFRTMVDDADRQLQQNTRLQAVLRRGGKIPYDPRVTRVGRLLRAMSLDELPQLLNVVRGEMSLVGPRPLRHEYELDWYGPQRAELLSIRPGMTGLWQVSGRNDLALHERVALDLGYARDMGPWMDVKILMRTVRVVLFPRGNGAY